MIEAKDRIRTDRAQLIAALQEAGADTRNPKSFKCCFHDDRSPSAGIYQSDDGAWHFKCHGCGFSGDVFDVRHKATGKTVADQLRELGSDHVKPKHKEPARTYPSVEAWENSFRDRVATYRYTNPDTSKIDLLVVRVEPADGKKWFSQARVDDSGTVHAEAPPKPHPIYNRTRVRRASEVIVVEGEKCVEAIHRAGYVATTGPGGAGPGKASMTDWSSLAGKNVYFWPDHDPADENGLRKGHQFMREVIEYVKELNPAPNIWWINPDKLGLNDKEDAADYLARFPETPADAIGDALDIAVPIDGMSELRTHLSEIFAGKRTNQRIASLPTLTSLARPLLPGGALVIVGDPGATKSLLVTQIMQDLIADNSSAAAYMLEDDRNFHLMRCLAQLTANSKFTIEEWMAERAAEVEAALNTHATTLGKLTASITDAPDSTIDYLQLSDWTAKAAARARVVIVDPITAIDTSGGESWNEERGFMVKAKAALRKNRASMILVTHPRGGQRLNGIDDMAGSRAFGRFAQTVIWLKRYDKPKSVSIKTPVGNEHAYIDREMRLVKVRNGIGQGSRIGLQFDSKTLRFKELGLIVESPAESAGDA